MFEIKGVYSRKIFIILFYFIFYINFVADTDVFFSSVSGNVVKFGRLSAVVSVQKRKLFIKLCLKTNFIALTWVQKP